MSGLALAPCDRLPDRVARFFADTCPYESCQKFWAKPRHDARPVSMWSDGIAHYLCRHCGRAWWTTWCVGLYYAAKEELDD